MLPPMIFTNGRLIFPDRIAEGLALLVTAGRIAEIGELSPRENETVIDLAGNYLAPGLIDLHVHGALGRDTMEGTAEAFRAICEYHATGGTTSLLLTTVTAPVDEIVRVVRQIEAARTNLRPLLGAHIEGPFISAQKRGAQPAKFIVEPKPEVVRQLLDLGPVVERVTLAPEIPGALELISSLTTAGVAASGGHSDAWEEDARAGFERGMC